jgi:hypothetical protein
MINSKEWLNHNPSVTFSASPLSFLKPLKNDLATGSTRLYL